MAEISVEGTIVYILCIYLHIHTVKNTTICQIVALCNIQLHVSAL